MPRGAQTAPAMRAASAAVLATEVIGYLAMCAPIPLGWLWVGGRVFEVTGSLAADLAVAFGGFCATTVFSMGALVRIDGLWVELRRRAGYDQAEGALIQVVVVVSTVGLIAFWIWFHILESAFIIPFMPNN